MKKLPFPQLKDGASSRGLRLAPDKLRKSYLDRYRFEVDLIMDVGVNNGTPFLYQTFQDAKFILIDPLKDCAEKVRRTGLLSDFEFVNVALGAERGQGDLFVPSFEGEKRFALASFKERTDPLSEKFEEVESRTVPIKTLDEVAGNYAGRIGLKIDTEGYEGDILAGGTETLKRCEFVILEVSLTPRFQNVSPPSKLIAMLADAGLEMRDFIDMADRSPSDKQDRRPRHADILFTKWAR